MKPPLRDDGSKALAALPETERYMAGRYRERDGVSTQSRNVRIFAR